MTAPLGADAAEELGFPRIFAERAQIVECGSATDVLEPLRKLLWRCSAFGVGRASRSRFGRNCPRRVHGRRLTQRFRQCSP